MIYAIASVIAKNFRKFVFFQCYNKEHLPKQEADKKRAFIYKPLLAYKKRFNLQAPG